MEYIHQLIYQSKVNLVCHEHEFTNYFHFSLYLLIQYGILLFLDNYIVSLLEECHHCSLQSLTLT